MSSLHQRILVCTDGSEVSDHAVQHAQALCTDSSELHVCMIGLISHWTHPDTLSSTQFERIKQETRDRLELEMAKLQTPDTVKTHAHVRLGRVDTEILRLADDLDASMIVIGNRGMGSLQRMLLGNDAESVIRHAACPVLVVR